MKLNIFINLKIKLDINLQRLTSIKFIYKISSFLGYLIFKLNNLAEKLREYDYWILIPVEIIERLDSIKPLVEVVLAVLFSR